MIYLQIKKHSIKIVEIVSLPDLLEVFTYLRKAITLKKKLMQNKRFRIAKIYSYQTFFSFFFEKQLKKCFLLKILYLFFPLVLNLANFGKKNLKVKFSPPKFIVFQNEIRTRSFNSSIKGYKGMKYVHLF